MTKGPIVPKESGNTRQIPPAKHWVFTVNNYTFSDIEMFTGSDSSIIERYVFQEETGENNTPHLQGYLMFVTKKRPLSIFKSTKVHWEKCRDIHKAIQYCQKSDTRTGKVYTRNILTKYKVTITEFYKWELEIIAEIKKEPSDRTIFWYWEPKGCHGKTTFQKWIHCNYYDVLIVSGKNADMKHAVVNHIENKGSYPRIILCNIPRSSLSYISYSGIEEIKDMFFHSGKYEGGQVNGPRPHFFIFANEPPEDGQISEDRWIIKKVKKF